MNPRDGWQEFVQDLVAGAHEAGREKLVVSTSGNLSVRLGATHFAISAARTRLASLHATDVVALPIDATDDEAPASDTSPRPSRETPMHRILYERFPEIGCVLHFQSLAGTTLACRSGTHPDLDFIPEFPVYVRRIACVPYLPPGSAELGKGVADAFEDPEVRLVQLRNHGQVAVGKDPRQVVERAVFFELAARIYLLSENSEPLKRYTPEQLSLLLSY
jgi:ribulose-5-phosphate 4-epimerase/fuculose-1-phosphate aldolase